MALRLTNPAGVMPPLGAYSHSAEIPQGARLIFISGQVPLSADGVLAPTLAAQAEQVYANLAAILSAMHLTPSAIVKLTTFLTESDPEGAVARARHTHLGDHKPASTVVWVSRLFDPQWKIEVEAIAIAESPAPIDPASKRSNEI